ncbi:maltokinase [Actinoplanes tereljensis]|uniref:Glucosamine kinase n=1 Tax=Paractinoplanes tereljensis TaxID=571912 RepID=A0A919NGE6_9ACTN|nr:hypothetical protein [Actinoplanes tereljensis]GIF18129.1 hypothetical protein Ate02nite_08590 [Actinoplanes tereljensis]
MTIAPGASADLVEAIVNGRAPTGFDLRIYLPLGPVAGDERPITVDQTNVSVVVGEAVVVKWMREPEPAARAPRLLAHLAAAGFTRMPPPHAALFRDDALVALVTGFLAEAEDGWDWCTDALLSWLDGGPPADFAADLGILAADLHAALATSSAPLNGVHPKSPGVSALAEALALAGEDAEGVWLRSVAPRLTADMSALSGYVSPAPPIELHGDLHVGQVLRWRGGYAVTDFDGNPTVEPRPEPVVRDLAQLRTSMLHVAEIANRRTEGRHRDELLGWGRQAADDLLTAYRAGLAGHGVAHLLDETLLRPLEIEQECRELIYAARFLPRWRYAPLGVLRSWYG